VQASRLLLLLLALLGHVGLHIAAFNRINAVGWPRKIVKSIEWAIVISCAVIPAALLWRYGSLLDPAPVVPVDWPLLPPLLRGWLLISWISGIGLGIPWVLSRPLWNRHAVDVPTRERRIDTRRLSNTRLPQTIRARSWAKVPANQLLQLAVAEKTLPVYGLPSPLAGLKIAHLSDLHLTRHIGLEYFQVAIAEALAWRPDIVALTGDICDEDPLVESVQTLLAPLASAPAGAYFVLGNHDLRVREPQRIRDALVTGGWIDLGGRSIVRCARGVPIQWCGNEAPWFGTPLRFDDPAEHVRMALSHSPDQIAWARRQQIALLLAGHTHGGQGRLPLIGPLLSPSRYGSRFASGTFWLAPTTMHVSRGLSSLHLLRINCAPELALLTLEPAGPITEAVPAPALV
jgi:predicted MPP superfamily phosphohydrolase